MYIFLLHIRGSMFLQHTGDFTEVAIVEKRFATDVFWDMPLFIGEKTNFSLLQNISLRHPETI